MFITTTSCINEIFDRKSTPIYIIASDLSNSSDALIVEYENIETDTTYVHALKQGQNEWIYGFSYYGNINDEYFPEGYVENELSHIKIYRYKGNEIQYLPIEYYDGHEDFDISSNIWFSHHEILHKLVVTDEMFEEE